MNDREFFELIKNQELPEARAGDTTYPGPIRVRWLNHNGCIQMYGPGQFATWTGIGQKQLLQFGFTIKDPPTPAEIVEYRKSLQQMIEETQ